MHSPTAAAAPLLLYSPGFLFGSTSATTCAGPGVRIRPGHRPAQAFNILLRQATGPGLVALFSNYDIVACNAATMRLCIGIDNIARFGFAASSKINLFIASVTERLLPMQQLDYAQLNSLAYICYVYQQYKNL